MLQNSLIRKLPVTLRPDARRVLIRPFWPSIEAKAHDPRNVPRSSKIISRILALTEEEAEQQWRVIIDDFSGRHLDLDHYFLRRFFEVSPWLPSDASLTLTRKLLIGSYFTHEYSLEAAALFNPSVVPCPDQTELTAGALRFILSLRAVGEGHISSIGFRCGILTDDFEIDLGDPARWVVEPQPVVDESFPAEWFRRKGRELGIETAFTDRVLEVLPDNFSESELQEAVHLTCGASPDATCLAAGERLMMLAKSNFRVAFRHSSGIPSAPSFRCCPARPMASRMRALYTSQMMTAK
jgi:hypothetical protein